MANVTGPLSSLPGSFHAVPKGTVCDDHPDRLARFRCQGETDSFGSEMSDWCQECYDKYRTEYANADTSGRCDWCKTDKPRLRYKRDYEEGMNGPVYQVCNACCEGYEEANVHEYEWEEPMNYTDYD